MAEKLAHLSWLKVAFGSVVLAAVVYLFVLDDPVISEKKRTTAASEVETATKLLKNLQAALIDATRVERENKEVAEQLKNLAEYLPAEFNVVDLDRMLNAEATRSGAQLTRFEPQSAKGAKRIDFYETNSIEIKLRGSYAQLVAFLSYLSHLPRILTFDSMTLASEATDASKIGFTATLVAYRYVGLTTAITAKPNSAKDGNANALAKPK